MVALAMEAIRARIEALDNDQLMQELKTVGLNIGPITATTKATFVGLLVKKLYKLNGGEDQPSDSDDNRKVNTNDSDSQKSNKVDNHKVKSNGDIQL